jgi:protoheme IX farnesyltransferase
VLRDFLALTKPRLNFLVLLSAVAGYKLGLTESRGWLDYLEFAAALFMMAGASSALNMWMEVEQDRRMARTASRPLPAGRLSRPQALAFGIALGLVSLAWMWLRLNGLTALLGAFALASYLLAYTPLKRISYLATFVGAVPGALPPVMGWAAARNELGPPAAALFVILFLWQIPHFLAIAVMFKDEYQAAGFMVMPAEQGMPATGRQMVLYALALIPASLWIHNLGLSGDVYYSACVVLGLAFAGVALMTAIKGGRDAARRLLLTSVLYLPLLFSVMLADQ